MALAERHALDANWRLPLAFMADASEAGARTRYVTRPGPARPQPSPRPPDPDLEPNFPVQTYERGGSYHAGAAIHALVGNIDDDPTLEILVTALTAGPLYAWNADGSPQPGWPVQAHGAAYPALGQLSASFSGLEVFSGHFGTPAPLVAYNGAGAILPGWPRTSANYVATPPSLADVNGDGLDEIFIEEEISYLHGYTADGYVLPGWPARCNLAGQDLHTPAIGDLDGDGELEIVSATGSTSAGVLLCAFHHDGTDVAGFPVWISSPDRGYTDTFAAIGDVDGDGAQEIVVVTQAAGRLDGRQSARRQRHGRAHDDCGGRSLLRKRARPRRPRWRRRA